MQTVGRVESLWRYPVKSMRGEELQQAFAGFPGIYGDRVYAFRSSAAPKGFPYLTAREQGQMLRCRPVFRHRDRMAAPANLAEAEALPPGVTQLYAETADGMVDVETPSGDILAIDDTRLVDLLSEGKRAGLQLSLIRSERALTDCRPVSLISIQTTKQLGQEVGMILDKRRFRANVYVDLASDSGFRENEWVGRRLRIGAKVELAVMERDPRCKMITLDPGTAEANPDIIRRVTTAYDGTAGVYAAVVVEGTVRAGDPIEMLD
jgi:MOSC domain-containing protein